MGKNSRHIELVMLVDDNDTDNFISRRIIEITKFSDNVVIKNSGKSPLNIYRKIKRKDLRFLT